MPRRTQRLEERRMSHRQDLIRRVQKTLEYETRVNLHRYPIRIDSSDSTVILEGEVAGPAAKKVALAKAGAVPGVLGVVDRLRVAPAERRGDGAIRTSLCNHLLQESEFRNCAVRARNKGRVETLRDVSGDWGGDLEVGVEDGVITLEGRVLSLSHRRAAGVIAWWTPGCRDVINALDVQPPEDDNDSEVVDALTLVLEMDPLIQADQIHASCRDYVVTLEGSARTEEERRQAEYDAWCLFAVDGVVNRIDVRR
jgi:osmotically-inducible protein OsmY